jgi:hypothetical protein
MIRASNPVADWIDRHLPVPVQSALVHYGKWLDRIRRSSEGRDSPSIT